MTMVRDRTRSRLQPEPRGVGASRLSGRFAAEYRARFGEEPSGTPASERKVDAAAAGRARASPATPIAPCALRCYWD